MGDDVLRDILLWLGLRSLARLSMTSIEMNTTIADVINVSTNNGISWWKRKLFGWTAPRGGHLAPNEMYMIKEASVGASIDFAKRYDRKEMLMYVISAYSSLEYVPSKDILDLVTNGPYWALEDMVVRTSKFPVLRVEKDLGDLRVFITMLSVISMSHDSIYKLFYDVLTSNVRDVRVVLETIKLMVQSNNDMRGVFSVLLKYKDDDVALMVVDSLPVTDNGMKMAIDDYLCCAVELSREVVITRLLDEGANLESCDY